MKVLWAINGKEIIWQIKKLGGSSNNLKQDVWAKLKLNEQWSGKN